MSKKKANNIQAGVSADAKKNAASAARKRVLVIAMAAIASALAILAAVAALIDTCGPSESEKIPAPVRDVPTGYFYDASEITAEMLDYYEGNCNKYVNYVVNGEQTLITRENYYEVGGNAAVMFGKYFDALKNGDETALAECYSDKYREKYDDPYAFGDIDLLPQRAYDIRVESYEEKYDEETEMTLGIFYVDYKIYCNEGDFRIDIDRNNESAPLVFETEEVDGTVKIVDCRHRYGSTVG